MGTCASNLVISPYHSAINIPVIDERHSYNDVNNEQSIRISPDMNVSPIDKPPNVPSFPKRRFSLDFKLVPQFSPRLTTPRNTPIQTPLQTQRQTPRRLAANQVAPNHTPRTKQDSLLIYPVMYGKRVPSKMNMIISD